MAFWSAFSAEVTVSDNIIEQRMELGFDTHQQKIPLFIAFSFALSQICSCIFSESYILMNTIKRKSVNITESFFLVCII